MTRLTTFTIFLLALGIEHLSSNPLIAQPAGCPYYGRLYPVGYVLKVGDFTLVCQRDGTWRQLKR
jgi:hypothetical protein